MCSIFLSTNFEVKFAEQAAFEKTSNFSADRCSPFNSFPLPPDDLKAPRETKLKKNKKLLRLSCNTRLYKMVARSEWETDKKHITVMNIFMIPFTSTFSPSMGFKEPACSLKQFSAMIFTSFAFLISQNHILRKLANMKLHDVEEERAERERKKRSQRSVLGWIIFYAPRSKTYLSQTIKK